MIKFIISALDVDPEEEVCYVAFTGKAATVLQQKGCPNATTAHKLLYKAKMMANGTFKFFPKDNSELAQYKKNMKDNSWMSFMNKGKGPQQGKNSGGKNIATSKGNAASAKQMNRRTQ